MSGGGSSLAGSRWIRRGVVAALATSGLLYSWAVERESVERANRMHRAGAPEGAASIYGARALEDSADASLRYNLGTALLEQGSGGAEQELRAAAEEEAPDASDEIRASALYNVGLDNLRRALDGAQGDSLRALATAAVDANRAALRLRPEHQNTKWNLAMAQRMLDSIRAGDRDAGEESAESALEADEVIQSQNVLEVDEESELPEDAPMEGEDEARADTRDDGPMSELEASEILSGTHWNPALLVQKLLALESRGFWGRRPANRGPRR